MQREDWLPLPLFFLSVFLSPHPLLLHPLLLFDFALSLNWWEHKPRCFFLLALVFDDVLPTRVEATALDSRGLSLHACAEKQD